MPRKQLTIRPKEAGSIIKFGKLPLFTSSLTHWADMDNVIQLKVEGRYYAIELRKSGLEKALDEMREQMGTYTTNYTIAETETPVEEKEADASAPEFTEYKTQYQVGRERFEKLKELDRTGELAECKTRVDICKKMGLDAQHGTPGYNWVSNQIRRGYLSEELVKYDKQNTGEYRFQMTGVEPAYSGNKNIKEKTAEKKAERLTNELEKLGFTSLSENPTATPSQGDPRIWLKTYDYIIYKLFVYGNGQVSMGKAVSFDEVKDIFTWNSKKL